MAEADRRVASYKSVRRKPLARQARALFGPKLWDLNCVLRPWERYFELARRVEEVDHRLGGGCQGP